MANIEERTAHDGTKTYRVKVRLKGFPTQTGTFHRRTDAKKWAQVTEAAMREGRHFKTVEAKKHTLTELVERYRREVLPTKSRSAQVNQGKQLTWWREHIGGCLSQMSPLPFSSSIVGRLRRIMRLRPWSAIWQP